MNKLFVVLFEKNCYFQYKIDSIIENSFNGYASEEFSPRGTRLFLPFGLINGSYYLDNQNPKWEFSCNGSAVQSKVKLSGGDYYSVSNGKTKYSFLIIDYGECTFFSKVYRISKGSRVFIGRSHEMNIVTEASNSISRKHAAIRVDENGVAYAEDLSGKNGIYINRKKETSKELMPGDEIFIMGTTIVYYPNMLIVPSNIQVNGLDAVESFDLLLPPDEPTKKPYIRTPRIYKSLEEGKVVIDPPTAPQKAKEPPFILAIGPSMTMSLAMLASLGVTISNALSGGGFGSIVTSGVMAFSMLLGALMWPKLLRDYNKRQRIANEKFRQKRYKAYLVEKEDEIKQLYDRNLRIWNEILLPDPQKQVDFICEREQRLWERTPGDKDFLNIRLGIGERPFEIDIQAPPKGFVLEEDEIVDDARRIADKYSVLKNAPISLSLKNKKVVGVVGDTIGMAKCIISNIVSLHAPEDVKLVMVYNSFQLSQLSAYNDLLHMWSSDKKVRLVATSKAEAYSLFGELEEIITTRESRLGNDDLRVPHYVVLVFDSTLVEGTSFKKYLLDVNNSVGVSTVFFSEKYSGIPKECTAIIQKSEEICGVYSKNENNNRFIHFKPDLYENEQTNREVSGLSRIEIKTEASTLSVPDRVSFLDMYQVGNVNALNIEGHWSTSASHKSLSAPIGVSAGGNTFYLDIHEKYHGCHGLVAGTTGSGKSEFLQAYILSLMINYSPNDVAFVLVDFKGGDMARPFLKTPHLAATISNLSGNVLYRALVSLEAEIKTRQGIFNDAAQKLGIDKIDINSYHKYYKEGRLSNPLPHLIIIIDEFAQLKTQHAEFMTKLIDIAQVGRSLGVHLILATQKPNGVVDPQIWSNSRFKVCLKVSDKQDSLDMISHADAALIKNPGRAIIQIGYDEIYETIQSGYSGADYVPQDRYYSDDSISVSMVNWPGEQLRSARSIVRGAGTGKTQLEEIVSEINRTGVAHKLKAKKLWLPMLPAELLFEKCEKTYNTFLPENTNKSRLGQVICGALDLPQIQQQVPYEIDFIKNGHMLVYGTSGTGKSTFIQTVVYAMSLKYSPDFFNLFVIDFDGGSLVNLSKLPHCADYVTDDDENNVNQVLKKIDRIIKERRAVFAKNSCANFESYISQGKSMPLIVAVLDNYAVFREKMYKSEDFLVQLVSAARACGIYFLITGNSKGAVYYKVTDHIMNKLVFSLNDSGAYRDILNVRTPVIPDNIRGRGLVLHDKVAVEVQIAVPFDCDSEPDRILKINAVYSSMEKVYGRVNSYDAIVDNYGVDDAEQPPVEIYEKKQMEPLLPITDAAQAIVFGKEINTKKHQGFDLSRSKRIFIGNPVNNENVTKAAIKALAKNYNKIYVISNSTVPDIDGVTAVADVDSFVNEYFSDSNEKSGKGAVVIDGFCDFYDRISDEALSIMVKQLHDSSGFTIVTIDNLSRLSGYRDTELFICLVRVNDGLIVGGAVNDETASMLHGDFNNIPILPRKKQLRDDQAFMYSGNRSAYISIETE